MIIHQLRRPFAFNKIRNKELNVVRYYTPSVITAALVLFYIILPKKPEIIGDKKYLDYMLQVVGILPGFYIAALAAGATFDNPSLDDTMPGRNPPELDIIRMGQLFTQKLTTRLFICHLFSYLSAASLVLAFAILLGIEVNPSMVCLSETYKEIDYAKYLITSIQWLYVIGLTFYAAKLTTITLHGLYFLAERMHLGNN